MMKILFYGDSITDAGRNNGGGSLVSIGQGYPLIVSSRLSYDHAGEFTFENTGISGNRVVDLYARIKSDCWNRCPDVFSILIGVNDVWHEIGSQNGVDAKRYENIYDIMVRETKERFPDIKIIIIEPFVLKGSAMTDENWPRFRSEVDLRIEAAKRVAEKNGTFYLPLQQSFTDACNDQPAEYWLGDGVHPTLAGHQLIADKWLKLFYDQIYHKN